MEYKKAILTGFLGLAFASPVFGQVDVSEVAKYMKESGRSENKDGVVDTYALSLSDTLNKMPVNYTLNFIEFNKLPHTYHFILRVKERKNLGYEIIIEDLEWRVVRILKDDREEMKPESMDGYANKGYIIFNNANAFELGNVVSQMLYESIILRILREKKDEK